MKEYRVKPLTGSEPIKVEVPGSKSITNRALMLAALGNQTCELRGVLFSDDSRAFLSCLEELGFEVVIEEDKKVVTIKGMGGEIPNRNATINVRSAGTAARFLTVMLAFAGGHYTLNSSEQMKKRPMEPLLTELRKAGVKITCLEKEGHFPFVIESENVSIREITIDTNISSQFASALLMSATLLENGLTLHMSGERSSGAYVLMTLSMMKQSLTSLPRRFFTAEPSPNSKDFTAGMPYRIWASLLSTPPKMGSPIPAGRPVTMHSISPPRLSPSAFATIIACFMAASA